MVSVVQQTVVAEAPMRANNMDVMIRVSESGPEFQRKNGHPPVAGPFRYPSPATGPAGHRLVTEPFGQSIAAVAFDRRRCSPCGRSHRLQQEDDMAESLPKSVALRFIEDGSH